jgi:exopolyphosphatase / guanosine-5'-triphosphate,3'-diphosphate pyrophosphatase
MAVAQARSVIDLGTNTFHLLVAEVSGGKIIKEILRKRVYVRLASEGINEIGPEPFRRGIQALEAFNYDLVALGAPSPKAVATAALRTASNASEFIAEAKRISGFDIDVIEGAQEALLIAKGVKGAIPEQEDVYLIMDIGGGSVEFILCKQELVLFFKSYPVGVAVLKNNFQDRQPLGDAAKGMLYTFLDVNCNDLMDAIKTYKPKILVGASGTFDVLESALPVLDKSETYTNSSLLGLHQISGEILHASEEKLQKIDWIPEERKPLITVAFHLLDWLLREGSFETLYVSKYALKEGVLLS